MYMVTKEFEFAASHQLRLPYDSPCNNIHGHNYKVRVKCIGHNLTPEGMLVDFAVIKKTIMELFDHKHINDVMEKVGGWYEDANPTAEVMSRMICDEINNVCPFGVRCTYVRLYETPTSFAEYVLGKNNAC